MVTPLATSGTVQHEDMVCQFTQRPNSKGLWRGDDPFSCTSPVLLCQIILIFVITRLTYLFLRPLGQTMTLAQIVAGIVIGPSFLGHYAVSVSETLFPPGSTLIIEIFGNFGFMIHLFVLGVQIDPTLLKNTKRKAFVIGLTGFFFPFIIGGSTFTIIKRTTTVDPQLQQGMPLIMAVGSMTSFVVTSSLLTDLRILNSELGRLAASTSMVSDACGWFSTSIISNLGPAISHAEAKPLYSMVTVVAYYSTLFFVLRPFVIWIVSNTPEGQPMKDTHFLTILVMVLAIGFCGEYVGQHAGFGTFMFGLSLPDGPPLGAILARKLDIIGSGLLFPIFCLINGLRTDVYSVGGKSSMIIVVILVMGYVGKFTGTFFPTILYNIPLRDAFVLALIMCCRGIMEIAIFSLWIELKVINQESFTLLMISMVVVTGAATPIVSRLYDPSRRYKTYNRRNIENSMRYPTELRILVCIHDEYNVPSIINLLESSNPTRNSPVTVYALQLMELMGRTTAILAPHHQKNKLNFCLTASERVVNAFKYLEKRSQGYMVVQHFTAVAPFESMHGDICTLALDKRTNIIIIPFHKGVNGTQTQSFTPFKIVNQNVIDEAPCSVGVLVDKGQRGVEQPISISKSIYRVAMLFLGGPDDREALAYSRRIAEHPNISLTVVWFKLRCKEASDEKIMFLDNEAKSEFKANSFSRDKIIHREEAVKDGVGTTRVIHSLEGSFDLFIVGRQHDPKSPLTLGLAEWNMCPELGTLGDILLSSDSWFSVLVVQQQPLIDWPLDTPTIPDGSRKHRDSRVYHDSQG